MKTFCTTNIRGGAGKTTDACNLAVAGAIHGQRVLAVDLDPQSHLSLSLLAELPTDPDCFIDAALKGKMKAPVETQVPGLCIIPSHLEFAEIADSSIMSRPQWEKALGRALARFEDDFDYAVIDTPATFSRLHSLAFRASDGYLISLRPEAFSLLGFVESKEQVEVFKQECGISTPEFLGYILNGVPKAHRKAVARIQEELAGQRGFEVAQDIVFDEVRWDGKATKSIFDYPGTQEHQAVFMEAWKTIQAYLEA